MYVGNLIGRGGDTIKRVQVETGARVQFDQGKRHLLCDMLGDETTLLMVVGDLSMVACRACEISERGYPRMCPTWFLSSRHSSTILCSPVSCSWMHVFGPFGVALVCVWYPCLCDPHCESRATAITVGEQ